MTTRNYWMWAEAVELIERAERLHRQFFRHTLAPQGAPAWEPPVDVFETERDVYVLVALPGVLPEHIRIVQDNGVLVVAGNRPLPASLRAASIRRLEIPYGRFERRVEIPPGRFHLAQQELAHGCLLIGLRRLDESRGG